MAKITLVSAANSFTLNGVEYQKGTLSVNHSEDGISIGGIYADFSDISIDGNPVSDISELKTWVSSNCFKNGGGSGGNGAVNSVTGDLVTGSSSDPVINLPTWVGLLRDDRVGYLNTNEGMTFMLSRTTDAVKFLNPTPINVLNLTYPAFPDAIKKVDLIFGFDIDLINNTPVSGSGSILRNIPTKAKQYDCWTLMYDNGDKTWDLISINSVPKWYVDERTPVGTERDIRTWDVNGKPISAPIAIKQLTDIGSFPPFANGVFTATGMNTDTKTGLLSFIEFSTDTPKSGTFPSYKTGGTLSVADGIDTSDAVNVKQLNALIARVVALEAK